MTHEVLKFCRIKINVICRRNHESNRLSRLSPKWLCGNSCTCDQVQELRPSHCDDNLESTFLQIIMWLKVSKSNSNVIFAWPHCSE